ncbi:MAG TPA: energy transducer TonB [Saprospiraceae bacterium]|nr:energy transducer TonB [Saprospiraceae bacterium]
MKNYLPTAILSLCFTTSFFAQDLSREEAADSVYRITEEMPRFPGCEDEFTDKKEKEKCSQKEMLAFIIENLEYPEAAEKNGVAGTVIVTFLVKNDGSISNPEIVRSISPELDEEALRIIDLFPDWIPGKHRGKVVPVQFNVPIPFRIRK